jgi:hypothetical protein
VDKQTYDTLTASNSLPWIALNKFVTENRKPIEFFDHRFLIEYLADDHRHKTSKKSSQIGETVAELLDDFHLAIHRKLNVIHTLHTNDVLKGFVQPKVDPIIANNPEIARHLTINSQGLKQFADNFVYFRGANAESQAISISADVLKIDEKDRSNLHVVEMFQSRLDFSQYRWIREFSNPSAIGYGVDETYSRSDQRHWFVKCHHCNHFMYLGFEQGDDLNHYVDLQREIFACGKCHLELSDADRKNGEWVAKWPSRDKIHGYWFSQMMAPWFTAAQIADKYRTSSTEYFYNFVLGLAYTPADLLIDRDTILKALRQGEPRRRNVVMGSDIGKPHWYWLATPEGLFKWGRAESWDELEYMFNFYECDAWVMDSMPEFTKVQEMLKKYPGRAFACQFNKDRAAIGAIRWQEGDKRGYVYADRTKVIDRTVTDLAAGNLPIFGNASEVEEFIRHAANMYRTTETDTKGMIKIDWQTHENKPDHLVFALVYTRIALEKVFSSLGSGVVETTAPSGGPPIAPTVVNGKIAHNIDVEESIARAQQRQ